MHKYFFTPLVITILALAIPTIAFEDDDIKLSIKYELNAELDELKGMLGRSGVMGLSN